MGTLIRILAAFLVRIAVAVSVGSLSESHIVYEHLEDALIGGNTSSIPNLKVLEGAFFPMQRPEPVCVPIQYSLKCNNTLSAYDLDNEGASESTDFKLTYLWTEYYVSHSTGTLLYSFSQSGITLRGFEWERSCIFMNTIEVVLELPINCSSQAVEKPLGDLTSQLKAYIDAEGRPKATNDYRAYAITWNNSRTELNRYKIVFTIYIIIIDIFIICSSLSSFVLYQRLYNNIKGKRNPGYSLYWACVLLSIIWNVGPSWLVLSRYDYKVYFSLAILIPVQLITALLLKKKSDFPIPIMKSTKASGDDHDIHSLNRKVYLSPRTLLSHIIQVMSVWTLLITFTFVMHYVTSIVLSLYTDPLGSLVKIIFVKAVIVCFIINLALLFAVDVITFKSCSVDDCKKNLISIVWILTAFTLFLILVFLFFLLVGVVFNYSTETNNLKTLFTIVPSATLLFASYLGHGLLFPKGLKDKDNPAEEVVDDLEGQSTSPTSSGVAHTSLTEATPLLPNNGNQTSSDSGIPGNSSVNSSAKKPVAV